jgi:hypothetical protein
MPHTFSVKTFQAARLIPVTGIKGSLDQERRSSSALLAVMRIVPEFAHALTKEVGAPKGAIATFIEPEFKMGQKKIRPDGLIVITRGKREWRALVEVKTGKNDLDLVQITSYLDICKEHKLDALITISNEVLNASGTHPTAGIDSRKLRSTALLHLSWLKILTEAIVLSEHVGVDDTERDMVLKELIRFLQADSSGASEFNDMGPAWARVRELVRTSALPKPDQEVLDTVARFESLVRYAAFTLSARLGVEAREMVPKAAKLNYRSHLNVVAQGLLETKTLSGGIMIPGAAAEMTVIADLGSGLLRCECSIDAPAEGRNRSRVNWATRQLKSEPKGLVLSWNYKRSRTRERSHSVADLLDKNYEFELQNDREITSFTIELITKMGTKRSSGAGGFIDSVVAAYEGFYGQVLQGFRPWQSPAPKLSESVKELIPERIPE